MRGRLFLTLLLFHNIQTGVLSEQENCWSRFVVYNVCEHDYGGLISQFSNIPSMAACGGHCPVKSECSSFMYNPDSRICRTSSQNSSDLQTTCSPNVIYAEVDQSACQHVGVGETCSFNVLCAPTNSLCVDGVCRCKLGYSYHPGNGTCVEECDIYGSDYTRYDFGKLVNYRGVQPPIRLGACRDLCTTEAAFVCRVFAKAYRFTTSPCWVTNETILSKPGDYLLTDDGGVSLYQRNCA